MESEILKENDSAKFSRLQEAANEVQLAIDKVKDITSKHDKVQHSDGLDFLQLKNELLLDYLINIYCMMLRKINGSTMSDECDTQLLRIIRNRITLLKMKPIEHKLKYQIDKYLNMQSTSTDDLENPLSFKPEMNDFDVESDDEDSISDINNTGGVKKYVPPKHISVKYDGDVERDEEKNEDFTGTPQTVGKKRTFLSKSIIEEMKAQYDDQPDEITHTEGVLVDRFSANSKRQKFVSKMKDRIRYEEDNLVRLPVTRKDKKEWRSFKQTSMSTMGTIGDEIINLGNSQFEGGDENSVSKQKRNRGSFKGKGSNKKSKKRFK